MYSCSSNEMLVVEILLTWHCQSLCSEVIEDEFASLRSVSYCQKVSSFCGDINTYMYDHTQMFTHRILLIMDIRLWGRERQYPAN